MDRLSIILTLIVGSTVTGTLVIAVLVFGWYNWPMIGGAIALGVVLSYPASYAVSRWIKKEDPTWDETKADEVEGIIPDPTAPEV